MLISERLEHITLATDKRVDNMHKARYIEIALAHRDAKSGTPVAECYNASFTASGIPASRDTAPQARVESFDFGAIKKELAVATIKAGEFFKGWDKPGSGMSNYQPWRLDPAGVAKRTVLALASEH